MDKKSRKQTDNSSSGTKKTLRQELRQKRNSLSRIQQLQASRNLLKHLCSQPIWQNSQHIACYLARDGEIDPQLLIEEGWRQGKSIYLPVVDALNRRTLTFLPWRRDTVTIKNKYGIPEPDSRLYRPRPAWTLDLVLLPLTGFDATGKRMGMGGGYYDRTFAFITKGTKPHAPQLVGLAHECQRVKLIPVDNWDIPLSEIYTDKRRYP